MQGRPSRDPNRRTPPTRSTRPYTLLMPSPSDSEGTPLGDRSAIDTEAVLSVGEVRRKAASGVLFVGLRSFAVRGLNLLSSLVLARLLLPQDFGVLALGQGLIYFGAILSDAGIAASLVRRERAPSRIELRTVFGFQLLTAILVVAAVAVLAVPTGRTGQVAAVMSVSVVLSALRTPASLVLERRLDYRTIAFVEIIEGAVFVIWSLTTVALGAGVWGVATAHLARSLAGSALMIQRSPIRILAPRIRLSVLHEILSYGLIVQASALMSLARAQGINLTTAAIAGLPVLGLYSLADRIMQIPWQIFETILRVTFPAMARLVTAGVDARSDIERGLRLLTVLAGPALCLVAATAPLAVPTLFGSQWTGAAGAVPLIALGLLFGGPVLAVGSGYLYAVGDARQCLLATVAHTVAWFAVAVPLLPAHGATAVGAGLAAGFITESWVLSRALRRRTGLHALKIVAPASFSLAVSGAVGFVAALHLQPGFINLVQVGLLTSVLICIGLLITARATLRDARNFLRALMARRRGLDAT